MNLQIARFNLIKQAFKLNNKLSGNTQQKKQLLRRQLY